MAFELAKQGQDVIIHGRDDAKAASTNREILGKVSAAVVDILLADLTKKADILA